MEIRNHLAEVLASLQESYPRALSLMACSVRDFLTDEAFEGLSEDVQLKAVLALGEGYSKEYNKDLKKRAQQDKALSPHYDGVDPAAAKWGKEAHAYGLHAHGMEAAGKAPKHKVVAAHDEAGKAHHFAAEKLRRAGADKPAQMHKHAAQYHRSRVTALGGDDMDAAAESTETLGDVLAEWDAFSSAAEKDIPASSRYIFNRSADMMSPNTPPSDHKQMAQKHRHMAKGADKAVADKHLRAAAAHDRFSKWNGKKSKKKEEAVSDSFKAAAAAQTHAHMAQWRAGQLKKKLSKPTATPSSALKYQGVVKSGVKKEQIEEFVLDEASYPDEVKRASMLAGQATKAASGDNAGTSHHDTAQRLHQIAHGVAKAHGFDDLAAKHLDFHQKHKAQSKAAVAPKTA